MTVISFIMIQPGSVTGMTVISFIMIQPGSVTGMTVISFIMIQPGSVKVTACRDTTKPQWIYQHREDDV